MAWPFSSVAAPNKDSGFTAVSVNGLANPPNFDGATAYWLMGMWFANDSDQDEFVQVTDGAGNTVVPHSLVPARGVLPLGPEFMPIVGVQWLATGAVTGKIWGYS